MDRLTNLIENARQKWGQPGIAVSIVRKHETKLCAGFGHLATGEHACVTSQSIFALASCSKPFAATTVAALVDDGVLQWDDQVVDHLPEFKLSNAFATQSVTVRDLLCNRIGISSSEGRHRHLCTNRKDLVRRLQHHPFRHPFRSEYGYCTDAFSVVGALVTQVAGVDWEDFARERIWSLLAMTSTNASWRRISCPDKMAQPHVWQDASFARVPWTYEDHVATPAGGVNSTAEDMAKWLQYWLQAPSLIGENIITQDSYNEILAPHTPERGDFPDHEFAQVAPPNQKTRYRHEAYALGWYVQSYNAITMYHHVGSIEGFRSATAFSHDLDLGVCVLANADNQFLPRALVQAVFDDEMGIDAHEWLEACYQQDLERRISKTPSAANMGNFQPASVDAYVGDYQDDGRFGPCRLFLQDGHLKLKIASACFSLKTTDGRSVYAFPDAHPHRQHLIQALFQTTPDDVVGFKTQCGAHFLKL